MKIKRGRMHDIVVSQISYWAGFVMGCFTLLTGIRVASFRIIKKAQLERIKTLCSNNFMAWEEADKEVKRLRQLEKHYQEVIIELQTKRINNQQDCGTFKIEDLKK